jgi:hypothetical protein
MTDDFAIFQNNNCCMSIARVYADGDFAHGFSVLSFINSRYAAAKM